MSRAKIQSRILDDCEYGRLVATKVPIHADYDASEGIMEFIVPSSSRRNRAYVVEVSVETLECVCSCEAFSRSAEDHNGFREAGKMPYRQAVGGHPLEFIAKAKGYPIDPVILRHERFLCPHCRKSKAYIRRHNLLPALESRGQELINRLAAIP